MSRWAKLDGSTSSRSHRRSGPPWRAVGRRSSGASPALLTAAAAGLALWPARAAVAANGTDTWQGNTSVFWATGSNWNPAVNAPPASGDALLFGVAGSAGTTLTDNLMTQSTYNVAGITFNTSAAAYVINPNAAGTNGFTLQGSIVNSGTALETINDVIGLTAVQTVTTTAGGGNITLGGVVNGTGGLTTSGAGTVTLTASDTYSGNTNVNGGTLMLTGSGALYGAGNNAATITVASGAKLDVNAGTASAPNYNDIGGGPGATWSISGTLSIDGAGQVLSLPGSIILSNGGAITSASGTTANTNYGTLFGGIGSNGFATNITASGAGNTISVPTFKIVGVQGFSTPLASDALAVSTPLSDRGTPLGAVNKLGLGTLTMSGASTYTGTTNVSAGTLTLSGSIYGAGTNSATVLVGAGAKLDVTSTTFNAIGDGASATWNVSGGTIAVDGTGEVLSLPGNVILASGGTLTGTTGNATYGTLFGGFGSNGYNTSISATGTGNTLSVPTFKLSGVQLFNTPSAADALLVSTPLQNFNTTPAGAVTKLGLGTVTFNGSNVYTGTTNVSAGTLALTGSGTLYGGTTNTSTILVGPGAKLSVNQGSVATPNYNSIGGGSGATWNISGSLSIDGAGQVLSLPGNILLANGGTITSATGATANTNYGSLFGGAGSNGFATNIIATGTGNAIAVQTFGVDGAQAFNTPSASDTLTISTRLFDRPTGTVSKIGLGTLTLSGSNTYSGGTTVSAGTLLVTNTAGSATGSAAVAVASGASLGGTGLITGATTVNGTVFPGLTANTPGATAGVLTLGTGSVLAGSTLIDLTAANTSDELVFSSGSGVTLGGSLTVSNPNAITFAGGQTYQVLGYNGNPVTGTFSSLTLPTLQSGLTWDTTQLYTAGDLVIDSAATPEPTSLMLAGLATAGLLGRRTRRRPRVG